MVADALGGRSCIIHWLPPDGSTRIISSSFFSPEIMEGFKAHVHLDPWTEAARVIPLNKAHRLSRYVPHAAFLGSEFYNEFVEPAGDDTAWCMGTVVSCEGGLGAVGVHRGREQSDFEVEHETALQALAPHLTRVLAFRGRLLAAERRALRLSETLDSWTAGVMHLRADGGLLFANAAAEAILSTPANGLAVRAGLVRPTETACVDRFAAALRACLDEGRMGDLAIVRSGGRLPLAATVARLERAAGPPVALVILTDPDLAPPGRAELMVAVWRLTPAEAELVCLLLEGCSPEEIAVRKAVRMSTVRSLLQRALHKTGSSRQSDLVAKASRLAAFREPS